MAAYGAMFARYDKLEQLCGTEATMTAIRRLIDANYCMVDCVDFRSCTSEDTRRIVSSAAHGAYERREAAVRAPGGVGGVVMQLAAEPADRQ